VFKKSLADIEDFVSLFVQAGVSETDESGSGDAVLDLGSKAFRVDMRGQRYGLDRGHDA